VGKCTEDPEGSAEVLRREDTLDGSDGVVLVVSEHDLIDLSRGGSSRGEGEAFDLYNE